MAVQAPSYFPSIPASDPSAHFETYIRKAKDKYTAHYADYSAKTAAIEPLTLTWIERIGKLRKKEDLPADAPADEFVKTRDDLDTEFRAKIEVYMGFRKVRDDIPKIIALYDSVIAYCLPNKGATPYSLDPDTLIILQNLKLVNMDNLKAGYDQVFTKDMKQLKDQKQKMQEIFDKIIPALKSLRRALEPLGVLRSDYKGYAIPVGLNGTIGRTPYVNEAVEARIKELGLVAQPAVGDA